MTTKEISSLKGDQMAVRIRGLNAGMITIRTAKVDTLTVKPMRPIS